MKAILLIFLLLGQCLTAYSQEIANVSADFDKTIGQLTVTYDLLAANDFKERYRVRLYYSQNGGKDYSDTLRFVSGDVGDAIQPGTGKKIQWNFFVENADFDGKNVLFKVEAERDWAFERQRLSSRGGPESALNSLILPGWGDSKVRSEDKKYWWITAGTLGLVGSGVFFALNSDKVYQDYKNADSAEDAESLLKKSQNQGKIGTLLLLAGGTAWLTDMILVAVKGAKNRREQEHVRRRLNPQLSMRWQFDPLQQNTGLALQFKF